MAARRAGHRFIFMKLGGDRAGIFEIKKRSIRMVHRIYRRTLMVKPTPWLEPAAMDARQIAPKIWKRELERQFRSGRMF